MALNIVSVWENVSEPETIKGWVSLIRDTSLTNLERGQALGNIRGTITFYRNDPKKQPLVKYLTGILRNNMSEKNFGNSTPI